MSVCVWGVSVCLLTVNEAPASDVAGKIMRKSLIRVGKVSDSHIAIVVHRGGQSQDGDVIPKRHVEMDHALTNVDCICCT